MNDRASTPQDPAPTGAKLSENVPTASTTMLKALAHPVRQQLHNALTSRGHARATDLAADLGLPANQISFHLRVLADAGIIEEAPEYARDRRDRVWKMKPQAWQIGSPENPLEDEALGDAVTLWVANDIHLLVDRLTRWAREWTSGRDSEVHGTLTQSSMWLTPEEFDELTERLGDVLDDFRGRHTPGDGDARHWQLAVLAADDQI
ncbi:MAG: helix-turn-helix domain-containing protein [Ruaniaceae bacterium]|nr:helix-turn-helix domain-containing protein [Ruaniaceae bacterium]